MSLKAEQQNGRRLVPGYDNSDDLEVLKST